MTWKGLSDLVTATLSTYHVCCNAGGLALGKGGGSEEEKCLALEGQGERAIRRSSGLCCGFLAFPLLCVCVEAPFVLFLRRGCT